MTKKTENERHSRRVRQEIASDKHEIARVEARNALRQTDAVFSIINDRIRSGAPLRLRPSLALTLNRLATEGIEELAGVFRPDPIKIDGSSHEPPPFEEVPELVEEMCDYVNDHWKDRTPLHLSCYVMWRMNWIHPFTDGNGRTARALSYVVLCTSLGDQLPGSMTIPEQISSNKFPYYDALEDADKAFQDGRIDVSALEQLTGDMLAAQLLSVHESATGFRKVSSSPT